MQWDTLNFVKTCETSVENTWTRNSNLAQDGVGTSNDFTDFDYTLDYSTSTEYCYSSIGSSLMILLMTGVFFLVVVISFKLYNYSSKTKI